MEIDKTDDKLATIKRKVGKNINQNRLTSSPSYIGVNTPHCIKQNHIEPKVIQNIPKFLSLVGNFPTGTDPENIKRYIPISKRLDGPIMKPIKWPIEEDGDDGTVQGLEHTISRPIIAVILPKLVLKLPFEEREIHAPKAIMDRGSQKSTNAFIISSILCPTRGY